MYKLLQAGCNLFSFSLVSLAVLSSLSLFLANLLTIIYAKGRSFSFFTRRLIDKLLQHFIWSRRTKKSEHKLLFFFSFGASREPLRAWNRITDEAIVNILLKEQ